MNFERVTLDAESLWQSASQCDRSNGVIIDIGDGVTVSADQMMMRVEIGIDAQRSVVRAYLLHNSRMQERVQGFVHRGQRHRGNFPANPRENFFGAGMPGHLHECAVNNRALMRDRELVAMTELAERRLQGFAAGTVHSRGCGGKLHVTLDEANRKKIRIG